MLKFDFLEVDEILGEKRLDIFKWFGAQAKASDFTIILGAYVPRIFWQSNSSKVRHSSKLPEMYTSYWTRTMDKYLNAYFIDSYGQKSEKKITSRTLSVRPIIRNVSKLNLEERIYNTSMGTTFVYLGEYPQSFVGSVLNRELAQEHRNNNLKETGRVFTIEIEENYKPIKRQEIKLSERTK